MTEKNFFKKEANQEGWPTDLNKISVQRLQNNLSTNAYYSPGVDRFFATSSVDAYTALEIAQILSSKIPGICVNILHTGDPDINSENCHEYTKVGRNSIPRTNSEKILAHLHTPTIMKNHLAGSIVHVGSMPKDYTDNNNFKTFMDLKEYAKFVIKVWPIAKQCDACFNVEQTQDYANDLVNDMIPDNLKTKPDIANTNLKKGITKEIKRILYHGESKEDAMEEINEMWKKNLLPFSLLWKNSFYGALNIEQPEFLKNAELDMTSFFRSIL